MGTPLPFLGKAIVGCSFTSKEKGRKGRHDNNLYLNGGYSWKLSGAKESLGVQTVTVVVADEIWMVSKRGKCQSHHVTQKKKENCPTK